MVSENHAQRAGESPSSHPTASTAILLDCLNTWGSGGSADKPPRKCYTWGYRYCRQDDLPGARARLSPAPAHPSRAGSLNFCSCCGSQKGGRILAERKTGITTHAHVSLEHSKHLQQQSKVRQENLNEARESHQPGPHFCFSLLSGVRPTIPSASEIRRLFLVCRNTRCSHLPSFFPLLE